MAFFRFTRGKIPGSDSALASAKVMGPLLPYAFTAWPQFRVQRPMRELPGTPQVYIYAGQQVSGLGGLVQGGIVFQPLGPNSGG